jgi:hypothetical protein
MAAIGRPLPGSGPVAEHPFRGQPALASRPGLAFGRASRSGATSQPRASGVPGRSPRGAGPGPGSPIGGGPGRGVRRPSRHKERRTAPGSRPFGCMSLAAAGSPWLGRAGAVHLIPGQALERGIAGDVMAGRCSRHAGALPRRARGLPAGKRRRDSPGTAGAPGVLDANEQANGARPPVPARSSWSTRGGPEGGRR